jgi:hypothetical protein
MSEDSRTLLVKHLAASPANVLIVIVAAATGDTYGVFRSLTRAEEWANNEGGDDAVAIFVPLVLDEPDFANVPRRAMA